MISLRAGLWFSPWMIDNFYSWFTVWHSLAGWLSGCSHSMVRLVFLALSAASDWWLSQWWLKLVILCQVFQICHRKPCSWHTTPHWLLLTRCVTDSHWLWIPAGCLWEDVCSDMKPPLLETSFHFHFLPSTAAEFWPIVLMHLVGLLWFGWFAEFLLFLIVDHFLMRSLHSKAQFFLVIQILTHCWSWKSTNQTSVQPAVGSDFMFGCSFAWFALQGALWNNQNPSISNHNSSSHWLWPNLVLLLSCQCTNCTMLGIPTKTEANLKRLMIVSFDK